MPESNFNKILVSNKFKTFGKNILLSGSGGIASFIILFIFFSFFATNFISINNFFNLLDQVIILGILVIGETFVIITGNIDISVGSILALTVMIVADLAKNISLNPFLVIIVGILAGCAIGFINGLMVAKLKLNSLVATLAMYSILKGLAYIYTNGQPIYPLPDSFRLLATTKIGNTPIHYTIFYLIILIFISQIFLGKTKFGRYVYGVGGNREAAIVSGIPYERIVIYCFMISGAAAGFAAVLMAAKLSSGSPEFGEPYLLTAVTAAVLGGASLFGGEGNIPKAIIGALVITMISNGLNLMLVPIGFQKIIVGLVLAFAIFLDAKRQQLS